MEKKNIMLKSSWTFLLICLMLSGCGKKEIEFIEITEGRSTNPSEPRIGIKVTSNNDLYLCREIIIDGRKTERYIYYKNIESVNFEKFKKDIVDNFETKIDPTYIKASDAKYYQLFYKVSSKVYKSRFIESDLTDVQNKVLFEIINLSKLRNYKEIPKYEFSKELLQEKLPQPPPL
ncbi:hypothetical protein [Chryseobacterium oncorhynchi]|uniref:Lipoprotein n=1 Tax=Chryseobacterium oncorhynchi TaxID=741074 RepID=A0A316X2Q2_9FLAO|nr:hypothetical protein [Chryseobacterium oncorhynchi]PWN67036.1 hypothetical protein C1638_000010 [Chryseobacterium oncorhynchi]